MIKQRNPKDQYIVTIKIIEGTINNYEKGIISQEFLLIQIEEYLNDLKELSKYMKEEW